MTEIVADEMQMLGKLDTSTSGPVDRIGVHEVGKTSPLMPNFYIDDVPLQIKIEKIIL